MNCNDDGLDGLDGQRLWQSGGKGARKGREDMESVCACGFSLLAQCLAGAHGPFRHCVG